MNKRMLVITVIIIIGIVIGILTSLVWKVTLEKKEVFYLKGVVDRIEAESIAVILVENVQDELLIDTNEVEVSLEPNVWVNVVMAEKEIKDIAIDWEKTNQMKDKIRKIMKMIQKQG